MKTLKLFILWASLGFIGTALQPSAHADTYYRFFRGFRRADVSQEEFLKRLGDVFIPAAPATHAKNGLVAYLPAVMSGDVAKQVADEIAIVAYESEQVYAQAKATPEGKAYADLHWTLFDQAKSKPAGSIPWKPGDKIAVDQAYDVLGSAPDWQTGHTTFWIGLRKKGSAQEFLNFLAQHVADIKTSLKPRGLRGYVFMATGDYEIAYQNWTSKANMEAAYADTSVKKTTAEAGEWMSPGHFGEATLFSGKAENGQIYNVTFKRRKTQDADCGKILVATPEPKRQ